MSELTKEERERLRAECKHDAPPLVGDFVRNGRGVSHGELWLVYKQTVARLLDALDAMERERDEAIRERCLADARTGIQQGMRESAERERERMLHLLALIHNVHPDDFDLDALTFALAHRLRSSRQ